MNPFQEKFRIFLQRSQAIDARIKSLEESVEESVRVLKHERNVLAPISFLPPEVFAAIFSFLCLHGKPSLEPGLNLARIRLSHVCHQWREIALNQSLLWSYVDFTNLSLAGAAEILARAKSVPLYLEARISGQPWNDVRLSTTRQKLQACIPRICHLSISAENVHHVFSILGALMSPAPTLEYLSVFSTAKFASVTLPIRDTLFDGSAPRLSCLKLRHCAISWKWPPLKGLKYLEIRDPGGPKLRPSLAVWLDALVEMPKLVTLTLQSASPVAPHVPFDVGRTVTLPSLTYFNIESTLEDCMLALAHLDLPALTRLSLEAICYVFPKSGEVQKLLPYVARYAQPFQSMLIRNNRKCVDVLGWPVPDIGVEVHNPPALLGATLPTCLALSFRCDERSGPHIKLLDLLMMGLPLDGIITLSAQDLCSPADDYDRFPMKQFRLYTLPKFSQLRRVRLSPYITGGFIEMLLEDNEEHERPLLPSLTELIVVDVSDHELSRLPLIDALMKRVEQGVPLEVVDLRMCSSCDYDDEDVVLVQRLSEIVVDVLGPESYEARKHMRSLWKPVPLGIFLDDDAREDSESDTGSDSEGEYDEE